MYYVNTEAIKIMSDKWPDELHSRYSNSIEPVKYSKGVKAMRRLKWKKVTSKQIDSNFDVWNKKTMQEKLDEAKADGIELNTKILDELFCVPIETHNNRIYLLEGERADQVAAVLSGILKTHSGVTPTKMKQWIVEMNDDAFAANNIDLEMILQIIPKSLDIQLLSSVVWDAASIKKFGVCEKWFYLLSDIPMIHEKMLLWIAKSSFDTVYYQTFESTLERIENGIDALRSNSNFKFLLQMCLQIGNFINYDSKNGNAKGVTIAVFEAFQRVKSNKIANFTLLMHLYQTCLEYYPNKVDLESNFKEKLNTMMRDVMETLTRSQRFVDTTFKEIERIARDLNKIVQFYQSINKPDATFTNKMDAFILESRKKNESWKARFEALRESMKNVMIYYNGEINEADHLLMQFGQFISKIIEIVNLWHQARVALNVNESPLLHDFIQVMISQKLETQKKFIWNHVKNYNKSGNNDWIQLVSEIKDFVDPKYTDIRQDLIENGVYPAMTELELRSMTLGMNSDTRGSSHFDIISEANTKQFLTKCLIRCDCLFLSFLCFIMFCRFFFKNIKII